MKQNEILDVFRRLVVTKGYEQMAIQDILDELGISKGAFYHYFRSKQALLESFIDRTTGEMEQSLMPLVQDAKLPALEKLNRFFPAITQLKKKQLDFWLHVLRVWYEDSNAIVRDKVNREGARRLVPLMAIIIHQGLDEGVLVTSFPNEVSEIVLRLIQNLSNKVSRILLEEGSKESVLEKINTWVASYTEGLEQMLGAAKGSIRLMNPAMLDSLLASPLILEEHEKSMDPNAVL